MASQAMSVSKWKRSGDCAPKDKFTYPTGETVYMVTKVTNEGIEAEKSETHTGQMCLPDDQMVCPVG